MKQKYGSVRLEKTRSRILQAFAILVQGHRYEDVSVGDVAALANISRSTIYEHFSGKDGVLAASIAGPFSVLAQCVGTADNTERLVQLLEHFWANRTLARGVLIGPVRRKSVAVLVGLIEQQLKAGGFGRSRALILPMRLAAIQLAEVLLAPVVAWLAGESRCSVRNLATALGRVSAAALQALKAP
jgi:AcrR family transcriptional regulator